MLPCNALKHNLNIFSNLLFLFFPLASEEIPQGVCGSATSYISNLRPRRLIDPETQECRLIPSAANV